MRAQIAKCLVGTRVPLAVALLVVLLTDFLFYFMTLARVESLHVRPLLAGLAPLKYDFPFSHSLPAVGATSALVAYLACTRYKQSQRNAAVLAGLVIWHWLVDFVSMEAALPLGLPASLAPAQLAGLRLGLGLHEHRLASLAVELGALLAAYSAFESVFRPPDATFRLQVRKRGLRNGVSSSLLISLMALVQLVPFIVPIDHDTGMAAYVVGQMLLHALVVLFGLGLDANLVMADAYKAVRSRD